MYQEFQSGMLIALDFHLIRCLSDFNPTCKTTISEIPVMISVNCHSVASSSIHIHEDSDSCAQTKNSSKKWLLYVSQLHPISIAKLEWGGNEKILNGGNLNQWQLSVALVDNLAIWNLDALVVAQVVHKHNFIAYMHWKETILEVIPLLDKYWLITIFSLIDIFSAEYTLSSVDIWSSDLISFLLQMRWGIITLQRGNLMSSGGLAIKLPYLSRVG